MLKNIYFKHLLHLAKGFLALNKRFKSFETSIRSSRDPCRELYLQHGVDSLDVTIHHRIWDAQKHLLQTLITLSEKILALNKRFKSFQKSIRSNRDSRRELILQKFVESLDVRIHHRIWDAQKHILQTLITVKEKIFGC